MLDNLVTFSRKEPGLSKDIIYGQSPKSTYPEAKYEVREERLIDIFMFLKKNWEVKTLKAIKWNCACLHTRLD
jgi:hypothetical protein